MVADRTDVDFSGITTRIVSMDPRELRLLDTNARFMRHEQFQRLVDNVRRDGKLTSVPFAARNEDGTYTVLSGNHRTKAAIEADLSEIEVMVTDDDLSEQQRIAIQLSHNAITGEDDPSILKHLFEQLEDVDLRLYSGLDDKSLGLMENVQIGSLSEVNLSFSTVSLTFLPEEVEHIEEVWEDARKLISSDSVWLASMADYERTLDALDAAGRSFGVSNVSTSLEIVLRVFEQHRDDLSEGFMDEDGPTKGKHVPLVAIFGNETIPSQHAATIAKALKRRNLSGDAAWEQIAQMFSATSITDA